jgi:hypothetical protein
MQNKAGATGSLNGTVSDSVTKKPVAGAKVLLGTKSANTNANGVYSITNIVPGSYPMTVSASGYVTQNVVDTGNTTGTVASKPVPTGGFKEYDLNFKISSTTVPGLRAGQTVWCAATTTDFPNLLTVGTVLTGNLDHSLGWWVLKKPR